MSYKSPNPAAPFDLHFPDAIQRLLEQGLIVEPKRRSDPLDDPRRRYYRITPLGTATARAESRRLTQLVRLARVAGLLTPEPT